MKTIKQLILAVILTACSNILLGQTADSSEFCGKHFMAPANCQTKGNMIKCSDYVFTWTYESLTDLPKRQKELLLQLKSPTKISVSVVNNDLVGYVTKIDTYEQLLIIGNINGKGVIINLFMNKAIKTTNDLPECVRPYIIIKP
ncbi:MAG: hypothetical protein V4620_05485 [Bacteroidota bacterium]